MEDGRSGIPLCSHKRDNAGEYIKKDGGEREREGAEKEGQQNAFLDVHAVVGVWPTSGLLSPFYKSPFRVQPPFWRLAEKITESHRSKGGDKRSKGVGARSENDIGPHHITG